MSLSSIRTYLSKGNRATWCVFVLFCVVLFVKTMIFHLSTVHGILLASLINNPNDGIQFWGGKIVPILFVGSFIFLVKKHYWTIIFNVILDLWIIANLFYFKANELFLSVDTALMVDNMSGFWDSLFTYFGWDIVLIPLLTITYALIFISSIFKESKERNVLIFGIILVLSLLLDVLDNKMYAKTMKNWAPDNSATQALADKNHSEDFVYFWPFGNVYYWAHIEICSDYSGWAYNYVKFQSVISFFPSAIVYYFLAPSGGEIITLDETSIQQISPFIQEYDTTVTPIPIQNIVYVLFESLESWPLDDVCGYNYLPNTRKLMDSGHAYCFTNLTSQTKHGNSADGQMIGITGMLPISDGAVCWLYGRNSFPNYAHFYPQSAIFNPAPGMWQQTIVTKSYQFEELIEEVNSMRDDASLFREMASYVQQADTAFCILGITVASHGPFSYGSTHEKYRPSNMPGILSAYLNSLLYTDSCMETLIKAVEESPFAQNTMIVITGDHTFFRSEQSFEELTQYAQQNNIDFHAGHTYTPLIIYSPQFDNTTHIDEICYQMDIYPTIMHLIGCEDYYWKGFGVNLLDSTARHNRPITEQEAYRLSDLMIRSDYFRQYHPQ